MALSLIFQGILVEKAGFDGGSYGVVRRKPLLFKRIDTVGQFISETPVLVDDIRNRFFLFLYKHRLMEHDVMTII